MTFLLISGGADVSVGSVIGFTATGYSLSAVGVELDTIAAVVIGGTRLRRQAMTSRIVVIPTRRAHSNHAEVARSIGVDIIAGRYAEGMRLPGDAELTAMFEVSRPVLRESVKTLVAKGLLSTKARVGTVVRERGAWNMFDADVLAWHLDAGIDKRFLGDLAEIRLAVEPRAAALAAARRTEADIVELRRSIERMRQEASDSVGFADGDLALHVAVANASGNLFMRSIGHVIEAALRASFLLSAPVEAQDRETVLLWHQRIVDAIADGDAEMAATAMIEVIHNGMERHERSPEVQATGEAPKQEATRQDATRQES